MDRGPVGTGKFEESSMVQETVQNHRRWSYQDENSVKGQKEAVTFSQPQVTSQQSNRGKKCPIPSTSCLPSLRLLPGLPGAKFILEVTGQKTLEAVQIAQGRKLRFSYSRSMLLTAPSC